MNEETRYDEYERSFDDREDPDREKREYHEETAAEIAAPLSLDRDYDRDDDRDDADTGGRVIGWAALALAVISLFWLPVILGAAAIILGFVARRKGSGTLGAWSIGIGVVSIIIGIFVLPFF